ncbi:hypothetical protein RUM43_001516 [Polyplax serrata]|uniref:Uncharacterized protein n=1 Tax=Polyplax serrata TaxID=468196 RepID=A0AAN8SEC9_POLSC
MFAYHRRPTGHIRTQTQEDRKQPRRIDEALILRLKSGLKPLQVHDTMKTQNTPPPIKPSKSPFLDILRQFCEEKNYFPIFLVLVCSSPIRGRTFMLPVSGTSSVN